MTYNIQTYIQRRLATELRDSLNTFPITALLGPRQCGKSTLAKHIIRDYENTTYLDLERPSDQRKIEDAEFFFHTQKDKLVCIDEVQMGPQLFPILRVAVDENRRLVHCQKVFVWYNTSQIHKGKFNDKKIHCRVDN